VGVPHHGRLARRAPAAAEAARRRVGTHRRAAAAAGRRGGRWPCYAEEPDPDHMRAVDGGAGAREGEAQQALAGVRVVAVRWRSRSAPVGVDDVVVFHDHHVVLHLLVRLFLAAAPPPGGGLVAPAPVLVAAPRRRDYAAATQEEVQAREARQQERRQAEEARAQAEEAPPQAAPVRRRRLRAGNGPAGRPALQPLRRAEDAAVARGARGRQDAVQRVRCPLQVRPAAPGVPAGVQPHVREQHPLQLPPQGAGDAPQEGGGGRPWPAAATSPGGRASWSWAGRRSADAVHFFLPPRVELLD